MLHPVLGAAESAPVYDIPETALPFVPRLPCLKGVIVVMMLIVMVPGRFLEWIALFIPSLIDRKDPP